SASRASAPWSVKASAATGRMNILSVIRIDRDRLASPFNRLVIILQPEIGERLAAVEMGEPRIVRALPNRLVEIFKAFIEFPEAHVVEAQAGGGLHVGRVEGERALVLRDGFLVARLEPKDVALQDVRPSPIRIEGERLGHQFVGPLEIAFGVAGNTTLGRLEELPPQLHQGADIVGIDGERLFAERVCCIRLLPDPAGLPLARYAL